MGLKSRWGLRADGELVLKSRWCLRADGAQEQMVLKSRWCLSLRADGA